MSDTATFERDIASHVMEVIRDDGVNRHVRFRRPGTMCMHFDLITWPGYLCYTGDMGTYVFRRLPDMFEFFRRDAQPHRIDFRYWAEKVEAADKCDGLMEFSPAKFKAEVRDYFDQHTEDSEEWPAERKAALWEAIEDDVLCREWDDSADLAFACLHEFKHDGFEFTDWERPCKVYSNRFVWCCHALAWGIAAYDRASADVPLRMGACT